MANASNCTSFVVLAGVERVEIGDTVHVEMDRLAGSAASVRVEL
jgi:hypothetical protein